MVQPEHESDSDRIRRLERELAEVTASRERLLVEVSEYRDNMARIVDANGEQLRRANARLIEATRMRDRFLANMSHELRGPLNPILGFAGIMLSGAAGPINEEQRRQLEMVRIAGAQLLTIVDDVLAFAETLTDVDGHRIIEADVCDIVRSLARGRERAIWERGVRLCLEMPSYACVIPTDPDIVSRAIDALLSNAVKYSSPESTITIRVSDVDSAVRVLVEDTGSGIRAHALPGAIDGLRDEDDPGSTGSTALGLGMRIVLAAVDALEAELEMSTDPEVGTAVTLVLPRTR